MSVSRRAFLRTTALAAAAVPAAPLVASALPAAEPFYSLHAPTTAPAAAGPVWKWYGSRDGELFYELGVDTLEDALKVAAGEEYTVVQEAHKNLNYNPFKVDEIIIERMCEDVDEHSELNPEDSVCETLEQADLDDLQRRMQAACDAWFTERGIGPKLNVWVFQGMRNATDVPEPVDVTLDALAQA